MLKRLWRQRRRIVLATLGIFVALTAMGAEMVPGGQPGAVVLFFISLALASFLTALILVAPLVWLLPNLAGMVEMAVVLSLVMSAASLIAPALPEAIAPYTSLVAIFLFLALMHTTTTDTLDHIGRTRRLTRRGSITVDLPPHAALRQALEGDAYPGMQVFAEAGGPGRSLVLYPQRSGLDYQAEYQSVLTDTDTVHEVAFEPIVAARGTGGLTGRSRTEAAPVEGGGTRLTLEETRFDIPWRRRLHWHLSDEFNDRLDSLEARLANRPDRSVFSQQFIRT